MPLSVCEAPAADRTVQVRCNVRFLVRAIPSASTPGVSNRTNIGTNGMRPNACCTCSMAPMINCQYLMVSLDVLCSCNDFMVAVNHHWHMIIPRMSDVQLHVATCWCLHSELQERMARQLGCSTSPSVGESVCMFLHALDSVRCEVSAQGLQ